MKEHEVSCPRSQFWDAGEWQAPCTCKEKRRERTMSYYTRFMIISEEPTGRHVYFLPEEHMAVAEAKRLSDLYPYNPVFIWKKHKRFVCGAEAEEKDNEETNP